MEETGPARDPGGSGPLGGSLCPVTVDPGTLLANSPGGLCFGGAIDGGAGPLGSCGGGLPCNCDQKLYMKFDSNE